MNPKQPQLLPIGQIPTKRLGDPATSYGYIILLATDTRQKLSSPQLENSPLVDGNGVS